MIQLLSQYHRLFLHPSEQKWAQGFIDRLTKEVKYPLQSQPLSDKILRDHIEGKRTIALMLLQVVSLVCKGGCIDIDVPRDAANLEEAYKLAQRLQSFAALKGIRLEIEFSGNRGFHVWLFVTTPTTGELMRQVLAEIAQGANFKASEIFPCDAVKEYKSIKLPYALDLKSGKRSGFITEFEQIDNLLDQAELMATFKPNALEALVRLSKTPEKSTAAKKSPQKKETFSSFGDQHPGCIQRLITQGCPADLDYNRGNVTLVRYFIARNYTKTEAMTLARQMAINTRGDHPTSKNTVAKKLSNFESAYDSANRHLDNYFWDCGYALQGCKVKDKTSLATRGCEGEKCSVFPYQQLTQTPPPTSQELAPLAYQVFQAIKSLENVGKEIRKSTIVSYCVETKFNYSSLIKPNEGDQLREEEALAYILQKGISPEESDLLSEGFISLSNQTLSDYLDRLLTLELPLEETFNTHLTKINANGARQKAHKQIALSNKKIQDKNQEVAPILDDLSTIASDILIKSTRKVHPLALDLKALVTDLFTHSQPAIKTPSTWLNNCLSGGLHKGKLIVIAGIPGSGKTTYLNWLGDYAAKNAIPVIIISYEMSKSELFSYALARFAEIDSSLIEQKKWQDPNYPESKNLETRLSAVIKDYYDTIAQKLTIIEAGELETTAVIKGIINKVKKIHELTSNDPVLVVIDYLQLMPSGDKSLDSSGNEVLRVSKISTELKQLARETKAVVMAISDINKAAYEKSVITGTLDLAALRDSFKIAHAADTVMLAQSNEIEVGKGNSKQPLNQLDLYFENLGQERQREKYLITQKFALNEQTNDTYLRLSILKNRGGKKAHPMFIYRRALHTFIPINIDISPEDLTR